MGLIARHLESIGFVTTSLSSAWSITASANPPRAAFHDAPLGHTSGPPHNPAAQLAITRAALGLVEVPTDRPVILPLRQAWPNAPEDVWKTEARSLADHRSPRHDTPQYERPGDADLAS